MATKVKLVKGVFVVQELVGRWGAGVPFVKTQNCAMGTRMI
jgi:hypothetical protein